MTAALEIQEENPNPNFYCIIPLHIICCDELEPNAKLLYAVISSLTKKEGYCFASNQYLANVFKVTERAIQQWLESLKGKGFLVIDLEKKGMITKRKITQKISPIISIDNNNKDVNKQQQQPPIFGGGVK